MIPVYQGSNSTQSNEFIQLKSLQHLEEVKKQCSDKCIAILFWAEWHEPCHQLRDQMAEMPKVYKEVRFAWCNSDEAQDLVDKFDINQVPSLALLHPHKLNPEVIQNPSPEQLTQTIDNQNEFYQKWFEEEKKKAFLEIEDLVKNNPFFMFIKGSPDVPKCKFTRRLIEMLDKFGYKYKHFDILSDERIRQWLKFYSNWPTFPQIFLGGKFIGGVDIVSELIENNEFDEMVPKVCKKLPPHEEFQSLLKEHKVAAIIEGTIENPLHLPSTELVEILKKSGVKFIAIDINQKPGLIEHLQTTSSFTGIPALYVEGNHVGNVHVISELHKDGQLLSRIPSEHVIETLESKLKKLINSNRIMLFMKGSPQQAACGFSQRMVNLLNKYNIDYGHFDIFQDEQVREGLKKYSNWPTYPQLYVNGELIGGIDIAQELDENGELEEILNKGK